MSKTSQGTLFLLVLFAAGGASAQSPNFTGKLPDALWPDADQHLAMVVAAKGVQIYECRASKDRASGYEWMFVAPDADLFDMGGKMIGRHYAGPLWESYDGSKVLGAVKGSAAAPVSDAIPWLLLNAKSVGPEGSFGRFTSVLRVSTVGGMAPKAACTQATEGTPARINYTADYYFFSDDELDRGVDYDS